MGVVCHSPNTPLLAPTTAPPGPRAASRSRHPPHWHRCPAHQGHEPIAQKTSPQQASYILWASDPRQPWRQKTFPTHHSLPGICLKPQEDGLSHGRSKLRGGSHPRLRLSLAWARQRAITLQIRKQTVGEQERILVACLLGVGRAALPVGWEIQFVAGSDTRGRQQLRSARCLRAAEVVSHAAVQQMHVCSCSAVRDATGTVSWKRGH